MALHSRLRQHIPFNLHLAADVLRHDESCNTTACLVVIALEEDLVRDMIKASMQHGPFACLQQRAKHSTRSKAAKFPLL